MDKPNRILKLEESVSILRSKMSYLEKRWFKFSLDGEEIASFTGIVALVFLSLAFCTFLSKVIYWLLFVWDISV